jgi:hypothetical protein
MRSLPILIFFVLLGHLSIARNKKVSDVLSMDGFVKNLGIFSFGNERSELTATNLIHQRLNLKITAGKGFCLAASLRSRMFISEQQKLNPEFGRMLSKDPGPIDLSFTLLDKSPVLIHTMIDRLYIDWQNKQWNIRMGRQRLNWGISLAWNPNDIFNTYNFLDFDYEERPGTDALKLQYNITAFSNLEVAWAPAWEKNRQTGAVKFAFNRKGYDFQLIAGNYHSDVYLGFGWAGSIKEAGFKGELACFQSWQLSGYIGTVLSGSIMADYAFKKGWYLAASFLFNNKAPDRLYSSSQLFAYSLSPKQLMPARYNIMFQLMKELSPASSASLALVYSARINLLIINPAFTYRINNSWEIDFILQSFLADQPNGSWNEMGNSLSFRTRWSFAR